MSRKTCFFNIVIICIIHIIGSNLLSQIGKANEPNKIIYVDDDNTQGPWDGTKENPYNRIYRGINAAKNGDQVYVLNGTYHEGFSIRKSIEVVGENKESTILKAINPFTVNIRENNVTFKGFTIRKDDDVDNSINAIEVWNADYVTICDNIISNTTNGIYLSFSFNNTIVNNTFLNDGVTFYNTNNNTCSNNTVNGKTLIYLERKENRIINDAAGQVILINCRNIIIKNQNLSNTCYGIQLSNTHNCLISDNSISNDYCGISLYNSNNNNIISNTIRFNLYGSGVSLKCSSNNCISNNIITNNSLYAIELDGSLNNSISDNLIFDNYLGINLQRGARNNSLSENQISNNYHGGITVQSIENSISHNTFHDNYQGGITIRSSKNIIEKNDFYNDGLLPNLNYYYENNSIINNTINGRPLIYMEKISDKVIDEAGQIILIECKRISIQNQELTNTILGILLMETKNCQIIGNNISSNNLYGIGLYSSDDNSIFCNRIEENSVCGVWIECSNSNKFHRNHIYNNEKGIYIFDYIEWGWEFSSTSKNNEFSENNIYSNKEFDASFHNSFYNTWNKNYWKDFRFFYKIKGEIYLIRGSGFGAPPPIYCRIFCIDFHQARRPYNFP